MTRSAYGKRVASLLAVTLAIGVWPGSSSHGTGLSAAKRDFERRSGARLVLRRRALPPGNYYRIMPTLTPARGVRAAGLALAEIRKYPRGYLKGINLRAVGLFAACASPKGDGFRPFLRRLGGYRYFGVWNHRNAVVAAYYNDAQLPRTLHHEIFHQVDATRRGRTWYRGFYRRDDRRFRRVIKGRSVYRAPRLAPDRLTALRRRGRGRVLKGAVSGYANKGRGEDQAETAAYLLTNLPDALVQVVTRPGLPGSQRLLHVIAEYRRSIRKGPGFDWWVGVALR